MNKREFDEKLRGARILSGAIAKALNLVPGSQSKLRKQVAADKAAIKRVLRNRKS